MSKGILDTNVVVLLGRIEATEALPDEPLITAITLAELSVGPLATNDERERASRQALLQATEASFDPLPFDAAAARAFGSLAASLRRSGRRPAARAYDALIAAIAISNNLPIHTCNPRDFSGIEGLQVVTVPHPDSPNA
jgi:tRNA(fMet)-specific endonuclease VapC